jgi:hypothetical protein
VKTKVSHRLNSIAFGNSFKQILKLLSRLGMNTVVTNIEPRIKHVEVTEELITAYLVDGRVVSVPLVWSWRLSDATQSQRNHWEIIGDGQGIHWPEIDEDISANGMLNGVPARRSLLEFA